MDIFNDVLLYFGLNHSRKTLATGAAVEEEDDVHYRYDWRDCWRPPRFSMRSDVVILGEDARELPRPLDSYHRGMSVSKEERTEIYRG